jgi:hypothetical protein
MQRKIGIWLWAIPVLISGLLLLPLWLFFFAGEAIEASLVGNRSSPEGARRPKKAPVRRKRFPSRGAEALVDVIARHKAGMLACAIVVAFLLFVISMVVVFGEHEGHELTKRAEDIGGYVAIAGLVLGAPALGYAMVTDRAVEKIEDALGTTDRRLKQIRRQIEERLEAWHGELPPEHQVQVFVPNRQITRVVPLYDPDRVGPVEGWESNKHAPQALTGSAYASETYLHGESGELRQPKLRLTEEQLKAYEHLTGVAAAPIKFEGRVVGVLTVFTAAESPMTADPGFIKAHKELARWLAPVVKDYVPTSGPLLPEDLSP